MLLFTRSSIRMVIIHMLVICLFISSNSFAKLSGTSVLNQAIDIVVPQAPSKKLMPSHELRNLLSRIYSVGNQHKSMAELQEEMVAAIKKSGYREPATLIELLDNLSLTSTEKEQLRSTFLALSKLPDEELKRLRQQPLLEAKNKLSLEQKVALVDGFSAVVTLGFIATIFGAVASINYGSDKAKVLICQGHCYVAAKNKDQCYARILQPHHDSGWEYLYHPDHHNHDVCRDALDSTPPDQEEWKNAEAQPPGGSR